MTAYTGLTRPERAKLVTRAIALCKNLLERLERFERGQGTISDALLVLIVAALQAIKEKRLRKVIAKARKNAGKAEILELFSVRFDELEDFPAKLGKHLRDRGIRYVGEFYHVHYDGRGGGTRTQNAIRAWLQEHLELPRNCSGHLPEWQPPYWSDTGFLKALDGVLCHAIKLSGSRLNITNERKPAYSTLWRAAGTRGFHYVGEWLWWGRSAPTVGRDSSTNTWSQGYLLHKQKAFLPNAPIWAAALVPPDWQPPAGVPQKWLDEQKEIDAEIKAEAERWAQIQRDREARAEVRKREAPKPNTPSDRMAQRKIADGEFSVRTSDYIRKAGATTLGELIAFMRGQGQSTVIKSLGRKCLREVREFCQTIDPDFQIFPVDPETRP